MNIGKEVYLYEDKTAALKFTEVSSHDFEKKFEISQSEVPNFGATNSTIWGRFRVKITTTQETVLQIANPTLDSIWIYIPSGTKYVIKTSGRGYPFKPREVKTANYSFILPFQNGSVVTCFFKIKSHLAFIP